MVKLPEHHVLNFFYDNDNGCALTVHVKGTKYHIIADASRLQERSKRGKQVWRSYARLLEQVKAADQDDGEGGKTTAPLFVQDYENDDGADSEDTKDSGVDVSADEEEDEHDCTPTEALQRWMLKPLISSMPSKDPKEPTVQDWYHCPTHYCNLLVKDGKLDVEMDESPSSAYEKRMNDLIPTMTLPKYINELKIPVYSAQDVHVLATTADPAPLHPARVRVDGKELFMKTVGESPFQPMVKRELQIMKRIEAEGLHNEIRVPLLRGLVHFGAASRTEPKGKQQIMGFVIDPIANPTPLTHMLEKEVPEEKRTKWAEESARMVDLLHQHGIIWGDAKGDNFLVDANDDLWIIDFGGSYTEGWVDKELKETEEGDKQGLKKLCNGLNDPENYTLDGDEEAETEQQDPIEEAQAKSKSAGSKRKHAKSEEKDDGQRASKQSKQSNEKNVDTKDNSSKAKKAASKEDTNDDKKEETKDDAEQDQKNMSNKSKRKRCKEDDDSAEEPSIKHSKRSEDDEDKEDETSAKQSKRAEDEEDNEDEPSTEQSKQSEEDQDTASAKEERYCYCDGPDSGRMLACDNKDCKRQWFHFECIGIVEAPSTKKWYCEGCKPTHNPRSEESCHGTWDTADED